MYPFNTLQICYKHIKDMHEEFDAKIIFDKFTGFRTYFCFKILKYRLWACIRIMALLFLQQLKLNMALYLRRVNVLA